MVSIIAHAAFLLTLPRRNLVAIILAQKVQLNVLRRRRKTRVKTLLRDRLKIVFLIRFIRNWPDHIALVRATTVRDWIREVNRNVWSLRTWAGIVRKRIRRRLGLEKKPGRPPTRREILDAIDRILRENPHLGVDRIHGELLKIELNVSRSRIARYIRAHFPDRPTRKKNDLNWKQFACALRRGVASMDFFTVFDFFCRPLYCLVIIEHSRRRLLHLSATYHPTQAWVIQQLKIVFADAPRPKYMISDNDNIFRYAVSVFLKKELGIIHSRTAYAAPWQNPVAERVIRTIREDVMDRTLIFGSRQACDLLEEYMAYYNGFRTHLTLCGDSPDGRPVDARPSNDAVLVTVPACDGLVNHYRWQACA